MIHGHPVYVSMQTTVFEHMSGLARDLGAINLGQGFPDGNGPQVLRESAARALMERSNQYPPSAGVPELRGAVAAFYKRRQGLDLTREQVTITSGATEGIAAAVMALVQPGDEVILFAPAYDAYAPMVRRCGGVPVFVPLMPPAFGYDAAALARAITPRTRVLMINDPLNPAGTVASGADLAAIAALCIAHDLAVIADEVWEEVRFDGQSHRSLLSFPGMEDRVIKIGSAGKIFGLTGWKIGWMIAAPALTALVQRAHQFLTFTTAPALQWAVAEGLDMGDGLLDAIRSDWAASRAVLADGLAAAGFAVLPNAATWFLCVDLAQSGVTMSDGAFAERAIHEAGVASIPVSALYEGAGAPQNIVRFCFTKPAAMLDEAVARLTAFRKTLG